MTTTTVQKEQLVATNKLLSALTSGKIPTGMPVEDRAKMLKITPTQYYVIVKRLKVMGKIRKKTYRRDEPMQILDGNPITLEDYQRYGDPYKKNKRRSYVKKKVQPKPKVVQHTAAVDEPLPLLTEPLDIPIYTEPDTITLSGPVDAMIRLLSGMKGMS